MEERRQENRKILNKLYSFCGLSVVGDYEWTQLFLASAKWPSDRKKDDG